MSLADSNDAHPASSRPRWQIAVRDVLAAVASLAAALTFFLELASEERPSRVTIVVAVCVWVVGWALIVERGNRTGSIGTTVFGLIPLLATTCLCCGLPDLAPRTPSRRASCTSPLKQLALALHSYHDDYGCFPPAYVADADGQPMHSWRVLILPYLERRDLYDAYDFNEPWDGPKNQRIANVYLEFFRCPSSDRSRDNRTTDYFVVVGPETLWPGATSVSLGQVRDRPDQTILLVESTDLNVHWSQPVDLQWSQMGRTLNAAAGPSISSAHPGGALAAVADGHVEFLDEALTEEKLRRLLTVERAVPPGG